MANTDVANLPTNLPPVVDMRTLAKLLGIALRTIQTQISLGELPQPFRQGKKAYWTRETLMRHFNKRQMAAMEE